MEDDANCIVCTGEQHLPNRECRLRLQTQQLTCGPEHVQGVKKHKQLNYASLLVGRSLPFTCVLSSSSTMVAIGESHLTPANMDFRLPGTRGREQA